MTTPIDHTPAATIELPFTDGVWRVDPQRSQIGFAVKDMWGLRTVQGVFAAYDGSLTVRAGRAVGELTIAADSIDTGHRKRDQHLRSPAFFDVEQHPRIVFTATAATSCNGSAMISGELAIAASRVPLQIPVNIAPGADDTLHLEGRTTVSRTAAGVAWNRLGTIRGDAMLIAQLTLTRRSP